MATSSAFEGEIYGSDDEKETTTVGSNQTTTVVNVENVKSVESQEEKVNSKLDLKGATTTKNNKEENKFEYPMQKYSRLKDEVANLEKQLKQLTQLAESNKEESTKNTIVQVSEDLKRAWGNIEQLKNNRHLTPLFGETQTPMLGDVDFKYLQKRLQEFQVNNSINKGNGDSTNASQSVLTLYRDGATNGKSYQFKEISERLDSLEALVGPTPQHTSNTKGGMTRNIEYLSKRLELLSDQNRITALKKRADKLKEALKDIKSLAQSSNATTTTTTNTTTTEEQPTKSKEQKINQMFEMMERWDQASHALPTIVDRLKALKNLHEESADIMQKVTGLTNQQQQISQTLNKNVQTLQQVNENLAENVKTMQGKTQSIEQKIAQLQLQIQKL